MLLTLLQFFATNFWCWRCIWKRGVPTAAQRAGGDRNLCGSAGGGQECAGKDHPAQPALVAHVAKKYYAQPGDQEDLISIGTIG